MKRSFGIASWLLVIILLASCGTNQPTSSMPTTQESTKTQNTKKPAKPASPVNVTVGLDWTPNTNHTGLYVAHSKGYYADEGLNVEFLQAQEGGTIEQLVATGRLDFGISYQENVTLARIEGVPIVSIAAIIQHNTSGFASRREQGIISPKDFEGRTYGTWGSEMERVVIKELMACDGGDFSRVEFVDIGSNDFFVATERGDVDFTWVFQGWTGIEAEKRGIDINMVLINDQHCVPDYYTPLIITSEEKIANNPDVVKSFMRAVSQGYDFAIASPDEAAEMLLAAAPELDKNLVRMSQRYLAKNYQSDAPRWGEQQAEVWQKFADWMVKTGQMKEKIVAENAFTNEFLP